MSAERTINMGPNTLAIPLSMFRENRDRVCRSLLNDSKVVPDSLVLLAGGDLIPLYNTDVDLLFQQVRIPKLRCSTLERWKQCVASRNHSLCTFLAFANLVAMER